MIADALGTSDRQARKWAARNVDPLRVWYLHEGGPPRIDRSVLVGWRRRNFQDGRGEKKVRGMNAICKLAELSRTAAWAAMRRSVDPLPVFAKGRPWAWRSAVIDWREAQRKTFRQRREQSAKGLAA